MGGMMLEARTCTLLLLSCSVLGASALVVAPRGALFSAPHPSAARTLQRLNMQVEAPVKIPDNVPQLAPTKPSSDKDNEKAKKYKVLLFNDNVNRREYVARVLCGSIPGMSQADAYLVMQKAHKQGMAVA